MQSFFKWLGFPIQKSADQFIFADPRSLSQLITSFIASESLGIPRVPFLTFFYASAFCSDGMSLFRFVIFRARSQESRFKTSLVSCFFILDSSNNTYLLSSLQFNFFQYVKELSFEVKAERLKLKGFYLSPLTFSLLPKLVENNGFEPLTPCVQGRCSSQLS